MLRVPKRFDRFIGLLMLVFIVVAPVVAEQPPITLVVNTPMTLADASTPIMEMYFREYEQLNPHITIENRGRDHNWDSLFTNFAAGTMADIVSHSTGSLFEMYQMGMLATVPAEMEARLRAEIFPVMADELSVAGRMIGVPNENMVIGLLYNRVVMAESGITEVPDTYDALEAAGRTLSRYNADGDLLVPGLAVGKEGWQLAHWVEAAFRAEGGQFIDAEGRPAIDSPPLYRAMERLLGWSGYGGSAHIMTLDQPRFQAGEVGFSIGWANTMARLANLYPGNYIADFNVALLPRGDHDHASTYYGHGFSVNKNSPHAEEAWRFLDWLATDVMEDTNSTRIGHVMSVYGTVPAHRVDLGSEFYAPNVEHIAGFIGNLAYAHPYHNLKIRRGLHPSDWHYMGNLYLNVLNGRTTLTQGIADVMVKIRAEMDKVEWQE